jgi:ubiquinone/menaquinone biosynthesis C-methylase UbiE
MLQQQEINMNPETKEDVLNLMESYMTSAALIVAMEKGLFWLFDSKPLKGESVANKLDLPVNRCRHWLDTLKCIGLLEENSQGYIVSKKAKKIILEAYSKDTWALLAQFEREHFPAIHNISEWFTYPDSVWTKQGIKPPDYIEQMIESPERARQFTRMLYELHLHMADEFAEKMDMTNVSRLMDLGGGSGVMSMALLRQNPELSAVVVDIKNVCEAGKEISKEMEKGISDRIKYQTFNFLEDELPTGFNMILECDLDIHSVDLFHKLRRSLQSAGRLVIIDQFAPSEGKAPPARLLWEFRDSLHDCNGLTATAKQIQGQLTQAGFKLKSENELSGGWKVIEAEK